MKSSYLFLAPGFEEVEAIATLDVLRRAGMIVSTVSILDTLEVTGAHGITVVADNLIDDVDLESADWLILPGGMPGATNLAECETLTKALVAHNDANGHIAAICASPAVVLAPLGILKGRKATAYPGFDEALKQFGAQHVDSRVVTDGNVVTANGPASAFPFGLQIAAISCGDAVSQQVGQGMLYF